MENKQKVHVYLLCYNEEDIIAKIIEYYSTFCSKIFILDNYSTDKSVEIAKKFPNTTVIQWKTIDGKIDDKKYIQMKTETYKLYSRVDGKYTTEVADWIISCDMDEILYHPNILDVLYDYKKKNITVPQITGFDIVDEKAIDITKTLIEQYRFAVRTPNFDKRIIFSVDFDMKYSLGAHPRGPGFELMKSTYKYSSSNEHPLALLHYKHIGMRFMDKAKEYINKIDKNQIKQHKDGSYSGVASHYFNIVKEDHQESFFLSKRKELFKENGGIKFENFHTTTGENGSEISNNQEKGFSAELLEFFTNSDKEAADYLRETALFLENKRYFLQAANLISEAERLRPNGAYIKEICDRLKVYKEMKIVPDPV